MASPASRWTGRCFDKVLCLVNVEDENLDSLVSIVLGCQNPLVLLALQTKLTPEQASCWSVKLAPHNGVTAQLFEGS